MHLAGNPVTTPGAWRAALPGILRTDASSALVSPAKRVAGAESVSASTGSTRGRHACAVEWNRSGPALDTCSWPLDQGRNG